MNILRRLPLSRLLLLCGLIVLIGVSATALAFALGAGPTPQPEPLATAVHDALAAPSVEGVSANIQYTNHLLEGANLASGDGEASQLTSSPLLSGASGRLWIAKDGRVRLELQSEKGDTQIIYDGHTVSLYDAATNTLYRYTPPTPPAAESDSSSGAGAGDSHEIPSVAKIEEAIAHLSRHAVVSAAQPTDIAGQAAYTVRLSPSESGSLFGGVELSWDAVTGVPLRAAVYSTDGAAPVIELAATEISYGPVADSVFDFTPAPGAKVEEIAPSGHDAAGSSEAPPAGSSSDASAGAAKLTTSGHGVSRIAIIERPVKQGEQSSPSNLPEALPRVDINGVSATELATSLGTVLSFERSGVRYVLAGSVTPAAVEAVARGL